jgi:hypothetical protein
MQQPHDFFIYLSILGSFFEALVLASIDFSLFRQETMILWWIVACAGFASILKMIFTQLQVSRI